MITVRLPYDYQRRYLEEKKEIGENQGNQHTEMEMGKSYPIPEERTSAKIAREVGVSEKTVRNAAKFAEAVDKLPHLPAG